MRSTERPFIDAEFHTAELPATPQRDYRIPAAGWREAPEELLQLGEPIGEPVEYKRRIGRFLLWRAGPPVGTAIYLAVSDDLAETYRFSVKGRTGRGNGADGRSHQRLRSWKRSLLEGGRDVG